MSELTDRLRANGELYAAAEIERLEQENAKAVERERQNVILFRLERQEKAKAEARDTALEGLLRLLEWSAHIWRQRPEPPEGEQYLVAGCPVCFAPKDGGKHEDGCVLARSLHVAPIARSGAEGGWTVSDFHRDALREVRAVLAACVAANPNGCLRATEVTVKMDLGGRLVCTRNELNGDFLITLAALTPGGQTTCNHSWTPWKRISVGDNGAFRHERTCRTCGMVAEGGGR